MAHEQPAHDLLLPDDVEDEVHPVQGEPVEERFVFPPGPKGHAVGIRAVVERVAVGERRLPQDALTHRRPRSVRHRRCSVQSAVRRGEEDRIEADVHPVGQVPSQAGSQRYSRVAGDDHLPRISVLEGEPVPVLVHVTGTKMEPKAPGGPRSENASRQIVQRLDSAHVHRLHGKGSDTASALPRRRFSEARRCAAP